MTQNESILQIFYKNYYAFTPLQGQTKSWLEKYSEKYFDDSGYFFNINILEISQSSIVKTRVVTCNINRSDGEKSCCVF